MPVYEFKCGQCGTITDELRSLGDYKPAKCRQCGSENTSKIFSLFAGSSSNCSGCASSGTSACSSCHSSG